MEYFTKVIHVATIQGHSSSNQTMTITKSQLFRAIVNELEPDESELSEWSTFNYEELIGLVESALDGQTLEDYVATYS